MAGIKDLDKLIKRMKPALANKEYVFCTLPENRSNTLQMSPLCMFKEKEGVTIVVKRKTADANSLSYSGI